MELTYTKHGDYFLPNLTAPESPKIGVWGQRYQRYMRENHNGIYTGWLLSGTLNAKLEERDREASEMFERLINQMAAARGITEQLKADDPMRWVGAMNNVRVSAEEIVLKELVYE